MTRQGRKKLGVLLSLSVCLAAGQIVLAADKPANENSLVIGGAAAVIGGYTSDTAGTNHTKVQSQPQTQPVSRQSHVDKPAQSQKLAIVGVAEKQVGAETQPETEPETASVPETASASEAGTEATLPETVEPETAAPEPEAAPVDTEEEQRQAAVDRYEKLGLADAGYSYLNVREKAGTDGKIIGKMLNNYACEILDTVEKDDGYWYKIKSGSIEGYVYADYILTGDDARQQGKEAAEKRALILTDTLNVRSEPSTESSIWTQADSHEQYDVVQELDGWYEIELDSSTGYIVADPSLVSVRYTLNTAIHFTPEEEEEKQELSVRSKIVNYAMQFLGNRYVWGGESLTKGVDCSGFTMKVYEHFGIYMSHYTGSQAQEGRKISFSNLKKGDLVFYAKNGTINHVAIYIGDGQVIHARSKRRGITITEWDYRTPVKAVTFLDD